MDLEDIIVPVLNEIPRKSTDFIIPKNYAQFNHRKRGINNYILQPRTDRPGKRRVKAEAEAGISKRTVQNTKRNMVRNPRHF